MASKDLSRKNLADHASQDITYVLTDDRTKKHKPVINKVTAEEAIQSDRMLEFDSTRDVTRVLFISHDTELLNPTQQTLDGYIDLSDLFDEVHVLILREGIPPKNPSLRVADNVWLYTATAKAWWLTPRAGMKMIENELEFADGFRPDLIVARDPFESAYLASKVARKYGRASQLHILDDYTSEEFKQEDKRNFWRKFLLRFTMTKFPSIRAATNTIENVIKARYEVPDLEVLPRYQNYAELIDKKTDLDLKEKYKPFIFFMVFVGKLDHESSLHNVIEATYDVLLNSRVGLLVLGDGPARGEFEKMVKSLDLEGQVIFEPKVKDVVPYLKSANLLLVTDTDFDSEEVVLKGAASGIAMVLSKTEKREDVFSSGESAFLCEVGDVDAIKESVDKLLNDIDLRKQFIASSESIIRNQFYADPKEYVRAYRASVEQAFFVGEDMDEVLAEDQAASQN